MSALCTLLLRLADDHLVLGHRLSEWCGHGPMLEEDLALPNIALDLIGQARALYAYAGEVEGRGRGEDHFAYFRSDREYLNCLLVERPNGDFAHTMLRQLYFSALMEPYWRAASDSTDLQLAGIAAKAAKEAAYHLRHAGEWVIRLGDGTAESARRMRAAAGELTRFTPELFETDAVTDELSRAGIAPDPASLRPAWERAVDRVLAEALLERPEVPWPQTGGRRGLHGEELGHMLAVMQSVQRAMPGLAW